MVLTTLGRSSQHGREQEDVPPRCEECTQEPVWPDGYFIFQYSAIYDNEKFAQ